MSFFMSADYSLSTKVMEIIYFIIGLLCTVARGMSPWEAIVVVFHFLIPAVLCWGGYRILCRAGSIFTMVT